VAGENTTTVDFGEGDAGEGGTSQEQAVNRYEQEQGTASEQLADIEAETPSEEMSTEDNSQDNSQDTSEDNSEQETGEQEDNSETKEDNSETPQFDISKYVEEMDTYGQLSEDTYKELENDRGIPRDVVDQFIASRTQLATAIQTTAHEIVGGSEQYQAMAEWIRNNVPQQEVQQFNREVDSGDYNRAVEAVRGMKSRYQDAVGSETSMVGDSADAGGATVVGYRSQQEMQKDMADPRYRGGDPAFHEQVRRKLAKSNF